MSYVIDRRLNSRNKSTVNRQRFLKRYRSHIQRAVQDAIKLALEAQAHLAVLVGVEAAGDVVLQHAPRRRMLHQRRRDFLPPDAARSA